MARALKVWGGLTLKDGKQVRTIVAVPTKKRMMEILDVTQSGMAYWSVTGNVIEVAVATASPETIFVAENNYSNNPEDFKVLE